MPMIASVQTDFTSAVLDPDLVGRQDIVYYYNGLKDALNCEIIPQGGIQRRPGVIFIQELLNKLTFVDLSTATLTAGNGGVAANLIDDNDENALLTAIDLGVTSDYVVVHIDLLTAQEISRIDLIDISLSAGILHDEFRIQYSNNVVDWQNYDSAIDVDASSRSRRKGANVSARYWRVVRIGVTDMGAAHVRLKAIKFWTESNELSDCRLVPFAYSTEQVYMNVVSDQNIDVLKAGSNVGHVAIPHISEKLATLNYSQSFDTLLLFHPDVAPHRIFRQGADDEFDFRPQEFIAIPTFDFGAGVGGVDEIQRLNVAGLGSGDKFNLLLEGERTILITAGTAAETAARIEQELRALNNTSADGIEVIIATDGYDVTFSGDDGKQVWQEIKISTHTGDAVWSTSRTTEGEYPGEPIMSDARGWPRCSMLNYQGRAGYAGFKGLPDAMVFSVVGDPYNLEINDDLPGQALLIRPGSTDHVSTIYQMYAGEHLQIFTNDSEYFISGALGQDSVIPKPTSVGIKEGLRVHEVAGAPIYVQGHISEDDPGKQIGTSIREFLYVGGGEQSYQSNDLSVLASHLINDPVDVALRKAAKTSDTDILFIVNNDGGLVTLTTLREQNITAFTPHNLANDAKFLAAGVDASFAVYFITEHVIAGVTRRFVVKRDPNALLDAGAVITIENDVFELGKDAPAKSDFVWTFDNPASADLIRVRVNGAKMLDTEFSVDMGTKTITLVTAAVVGDVVRVAKMIDQVTGADHLEGETVQTFIDGNPTGDVIIAGGGFDLVVPADTEIQYGYDYQVCGTLMPVRIQETPGGLAFSKKRVVEVGLFLSKTGDIQIQANGGKWRDVALVKMDDDILDRSMMELLFTGTVEIKGILGWSDAAEVSFRQTVPAPMTILAIHREVSI